MTTPTLFPSDLTFRSDQLERARWEAQQADKVPDWYERRVRLLDELDETPKRVDEDEEHYNEWREQAL